MSDRIKLSDIYAEVSRRASQGRDRIDVVDTQVVLATFFDLLREGDSARLAATVSAGLKQSANRCKRRRKK